LMKVFNFLPHKDVRLIARDAIKAIKKADMAIEINPAGLRKPVLEQYPSASLMELIAEHDIPITFGSDAHATEHIGFSREVMIRDAGASGLHSHAGAWERGKRGRVSEAS